MAGAVVMVIALALGAGGWSMMILGIADAPMWGRLAVGLIIGWLTFLVCLLRVALHHAAHREEQS